jgi:signal transduction histidine kinase
MSEETRQRIFEPYFTTKEADRGTGLGLPSVMAIVQKAGGTIDAQSELGPGTCFRIHLPLREHPSA